MKPPQATSYDMLNVDSKCVHLGPAGWRLVDGTGDTSWLDNL